MKASTIFGFLVMLSSQALALQLDGTFTVASARTQFYLKEDGSGQITFSEESPQGWFFVEAEKGRYAIGNNVTSHYISCGSGEGAICQPTDDFQLFQIDNPSDNVYGFFDPESKMLLYRSTDDHLALFLPHSSDDWLFELTQV